MLEVLIEAVLLGERAGADMRILTTLYFVRVPSIVILVPLMFFIVTVEVVESASNVPMSEALYGASDMSIIL